ncbi:MAG: hypothetical protein WBK96_05715 [Candidatus Manganitrophaceae bacterium]
MKWNQFFRKNLVFFSFCALLPFHGVSFGAEPSNPDKTVVLDESMIKGGAASKKKGGGGATEALPALSTALPWEGETEGEDPEMTREIFRQITHPDLSFFEGDRMNEDESNRGDSNGNR